MKAMLLLCLLLSGCWAGDRVSHVTPGKVIFINDQLCIKSQPGDSLLFYSIIFETDKKRIERYPNGKYPYTCIDSSLTKRSGLYGIKYNLIEKNSNNDYGVSLILDLESKSVQEVVQN